MPVSFRVEEDSPSSSSEGDENPDESFTEAEEAAMRSLSHTGRGHVEVGSAGGESGIWVRYTVSCLRN